MMGLPRRLFLVRSAFPVGFVDAVGVGFHVPTPVLLSPPVARAAASPYTPTSPTGTGGTAMTPPPPFVASSHLADLALDLLADGGEGGAGGEGGGGGGGGGEVRGGERRGVAWNWWSAASASKWASLSAASEGEERGVGASASGSAAECFPASSERRAAGYVWWGPTPQAPLPRAVPQPTRWQADATASQEQLRTTAPPSAQPQSPAAVSTKARLQREQRQGRSASRKETSGKKWYHLVDWRDVVESDGDLRPARLPGKKEKQKHPHHPYPEQVNKVGKRSAAKEQPPLSTSRSVLNLVLTRRGLEYVERQLELLQYYWRLPAEDEISQFQRRAIYESTYAAKQRKRWWKKQGGAAGEEEQQQQQKQAVGEGEQEVPVLPEYWRKMVDEFEKEQRGLENWDGNEQVQRFVRELRGLAPPDWLADVAPSGKAASRLSPVSVLWQRLAPRYVQQCKQIHEIDNYVRSRLGRHWAEPFLEIFAEELFKDDWRVRWFQKVIVDEGSLPFIVRHLHHWMDEKNLHHLGDTALKPVVDDLQWCLEYGHQMLQQYTAWKISKGWTEAASSSKDRLSAPDTRVPGGWTEAASSSKDRLVAPDSGISGGWTEAASSSKDRLVAPDSGISGGWTEAASSSKDRLSAPDTRVPGGWTEAASSSKDRLSAPETRVLGRARSEAFHGSTTSATMACNSASKSGRDPMEVVEREAGEAGEAVGASASQIVALVKQLLEEKSTAREATASSTNPYRYQ